MKQPNLIICFLTVLAILNSPQNFARNPEVPGNQISKAISGEIKVLPFSPSEVVLNSSWIKEREALNTTYLHQLDPERLVHNFRVNAGLSSLAKPLEGWESPDCGLRGHFVGHYLSACATLIAKDGDALLSKRISYMIDELAGCQQKMGGKYLSAFPESEFDTLEKRYGGVWAPYYTFHKIMQGLLDVYTLTGNKKSYLILLNMTDYVEARMSKLPEAKIEKILYSAEANPTNEAGGMNEVLHNLYAVSKDPHVISFKGRFLMYYSVPGYTDQAGVVHGWGVGIAESKDLVNWTRMGEVNIDPEATYETKGFAAPCALVVKNKVHLFYQKYGNGTKDAICHAWSSDGICFTRNKTNPIFSPDGDWNCGRAIDAEVIPFNGKYYLYYATRDPNYKIQMQGVAVALGKTKFNKQDWTNLSKDAPMLKPELPWERDCIEAAFF